jgi:hypothetical protein
VTFRAERLCQFQPRQATAGSSNNLNSRLS